MFLKLTLYNEDKSSDDKVFVNSNLIQYFKQNHSATEIFVNKQIFVTEKATNIAAMINGGKNE